jgi:hypothetical protein
MVVASDGNKVRVLGEGFTEGVAVRVVPCVIQSGKDSASNILRVFTHG